MPRRLYIVATSGFAKEMAQLADAICQSTQCWDEIVYLSENQQEIGRQLAFGKVIGTDDLLFSETQPKDVVIGIGVPSIRRRVANRLRTYKHLRFPNLIHPKAHVDPRLVKLGVGNLITVGSVFTCDIVVGDFNVFNLNITVGHDACVGSFNVFNPSCNVSGNVQIGDECLVGTGSQILEGLRLASRSNLGAGAVLVKSIDEEGKTLVGVPARPKTTQIERHG